MPKILTYFSPPPLPFRDMDWMAVTEDYDAEFTGEEDGYISPHPVGYGPTEEAAIADLMAQLEDRA
jgi:hypothetical protein